MPDGERSASLGVTRWLFHVIPLYRGLMMLENGMLATTRVIFIWEGWMRPY